MPYWGQWLLCELIDTLWNVNDIVLLDLGLPDMELIDTLWNVNYGEQRKLEIARAELIDTLWNVNISLYP